MSTDVEQIKEKLDIVDVISGYIKVEKAGINFKARCPFHNEKTPSFFISPTRQSFYCFGCQEKGDMFSFVEKFENLDFRGALETLASRAGIELKKFKQEDRPGEKDRLFEIMETAAKIYEKQLASKSAVLKYLEKRGLTRASVARWRLGFAEESWRGLHDYLTQRRFSREEMLLVGLIKKVPSESKYYDTFRDRIMFPISDSAGRVIAFSGRAMKEDLKTPKYLNSPETRLFYKSEVLYGFHLAKNHIRKQDYTVLVEGQLDLIMSHQAGVLNAVASSGTALTELHLKKMQKLSNRVVIAYDSDAAGERASVRAATLALTLGMEVKMASLPKGEDPASVIKDNPEKWKEAIKMSQHFTDFVISKAVRENQGRNLTREILKNVLPVANLIKSDIEKSQFIKKVSLSMKVGEQAVWDDLKKINAAEKESVGTDTYAKTRAADLDRIMTAMVFLEESQDKGPKHLRTKWGKIVGAKAVEEILNNFEADREALIFEAEKYNIEGDSEKMAEDMMQRIEMRHLKAKLQEATILLDDENLSKQKEAQIKSDFKNIQKRIKELNN